MSKFKAGDKVKCIAVGANEHIKFGEIYEVIENANSSSDYIYLKGLVYNYPQRFFELAEYNGFSNGKAMNMTVADLKPFQRVTLRNRDTAIVAVNESGDVALCFGESWTDATFDSKDSQWDIVEVYAPAPYIYQALDKSIRGSLVWKTSGDKARKEAIAKADAEIAAARYALAQAEAARNAL